MFVDLCECFYFSQPCIFSSLLHQATGHRAPKYVYYPGRCVRSGAGGIAGSEVDYRNTQCYIQSHSQEFEVTSKGEKALRYTLKVIVPSAQFSATANKHKKCINSRATNLKEVVCGRLFPSPRPQKSLCAVPAVCNSGELLCPLLLRRGKQQRQQKEAISTSAEGKVSRKTRAAAAFLGITQRVCVSVLFCVCDCAASLTRVNRAKCRALPSRRPDRTFADPGERATEYRCHRELPVSSRWEYKPQ